MKRKEDNKNSRKVLIPIYLLAILLIGSLGYSWWGGTISDPGDEVAKAPVITIGEGKAVETTIKLDNIAEATGKKLVPAGRVDQSVGDIKENTDTYKFNIPVNWKEADGNGLTKGVAGTITATAGTVNAGNGDSSLINVEVETGQAITLDGGTVNVPVTVTMKEPETKEAYDAIKTATISFDVTISVAQVQ
ncbi:MAG: hypothetical protein Q4E02_04860 [Lagierella massiliensis]|nr:hypothetical protein [Lagierella massiliensis]